MIVHSPGRKHKECRDFFLIKNYESSPWETTTITPDVYLGFNGGCRYHFRGEKYAKKESCRHLVGTVRSRVEASFQVACVFLELMRPGLSSADIYSQDGIVFGMISVHGSGLQGEPSQMIDIQVFCKCLEEYKDMPVVDILERKNEIQANGRMLIRALSGEFSGLKMRPRKAIEDIGHSVLPTGDFLFSPITGPLEL